MSFLGRPKAQRMKLPTTDADGAAVVRSLAVVDAAGKPRIVLGCAPDSGEPTIVLMTNDGKLGAHVSLAAGGSPGLVLCDSAGVARAMLSVEADTGNAHLTLCSPEGRPEFVLGRVPSKQD